MTKLLRIEVIMDKPLKVQPIKRFLKLILLIFFILMWFGGMALSVSDTSLPYDVSELKPLPSELDRTINEMMIIPSLLIAIFAAPPLIISFKDNPWALDILAGIFFFFCLFEVSIFVFILILKYGFEIDLYELSKNTAIGKHVMGHLDIIQAQMGYHRMDSFTYETISKICCINDIGCATPNSTDFYQKDCLDMVSTFFKDHPTVIIGITLSTMILPLICLLVLYISAPDFKLKKIEVKVVDDTIIA